MNVTVKGCVAVSILSENKKLMSGEGCFIGGKQPQNFSADARDVHIQEMLYPFVPIRLWGWLPTVTFFTFRIGE